MKIEKVGELSGHKGSIYRISKGESTVLTTLYQPYTLGYNLNIDLEDSFSDVYSVWLNLTNYTLEVNSYQDQNNRDSD